VASGDETYLTRAQTVLAACKLEIFIARDGTGLWTALRHAEAPRIVILDMSLPGEGGMDTLRKIRASLKERPPYVLVLSTSSAPEFLTEAFACGADDYLSKSQNDVELLARVCLGDRIAELTHELYVNTTLDTLTKLRNRRAILDILVREMGRRDREEYALSLVFLCIDQIAETNETYGHLIGDAVLRDVAQRVSAILRPYDHIGRYGGAKLLMVLPHCTAAGALEVAGRARMGVVANPVDSEAGNILVSVSIGIATIVGEKKEALHKLLQSAEKAVGYAKERGGNRVELAGAYSD